MAKTIFILKNKLPLVLGTGFLAGSMVASASAQTTLADDAQWLCRQNPAGNGWQCGVIPRKAGPIPFAPRGVPKAASKPAADIPVTVTGHTNATTSAQAVTAATAPESVQAAAVPVADGRSESVARAFATLDWVPLEQLPAKQQASYRAQVCHGGYLEPERPGLDFTGDINDTPIHAEADSSSHQENGQGTLTGNVVLRQGYRQIECDEAKLNRSTGAGSFTGNVVIREPNLLLVGDQASFNMDSTRAEISNARYVLHSQRVRGEADRILRRESGIVDMDGASYSTCKPGDCSWQLKGSKVELNPLTGQGTARHATLELWNLPVFYTPIISFPIDDRRKSGLLFPTIAYDSGENGNGLDYTQPIYWNIAPNMDATITPRVMSKRGLLVENEFRYLGKSFRSEIGAAYSTPDRVKQKNLNYNHNRWLVNLHHQQQLTDNWKYRINYTNTSDREYFRDLGSSLKIASQGPLKKELYTSYQGGQDNHHWKATLGTLKLKNMKQDADDPYNKNIDFDLNGAWGQATGVKVDYALGYTDFQRDQEWKYQKQVDAGRGNESRKGQWGKGPNNITSAVGQRLNADATVKYRFQNSYSFVEPGVQLRSVNYNLKRVDENSTKIASVNGKPTTVTYKSQGFSTRDAQRPGTAGATYYLDSGLTFERVASFGEMNFTHTLEPRAKYVYTPYHKDQELNPNFDSSESSFTYSTLWKNDRFSGPDRIGDTNQLALGITSRFLEENGYERFRMGIGQIFYFQDRKLFIDQTLNAKSNNNDDTNLNQANQRRIDANKASTSPLATQLVWNIRKDLRLTQDWMYNTNSGHNQDYALAMQYRPKAGSVLNARYRYRDQVDRAEKHRTGPDKGNNTGRFVNGNLEEADFSAVWPVSTHWSLLGRYTYDLTNKRHMERAVGVERNNCCYMMRVLYRNRIDPSEAIDTAQADQGIFFEFVLKGLGNITSSKVGTFLNDISGYSSREDK